MDYSYATGDYPQYSEFFKLIAGTEKSYTSATFSFLAVRDQSGGLTLYQGHVELSASPPVGNLIEVNTPSICGFSIRLSELGLDCKMLDFKLRSGGLDTPFGRLVWGETRGQENSTLYAHFQRFPLDFDQRQAHPLVLSISGAQHLFVNRYAEFQNDLRATSRPYDSISDLAAELNLRPLRLDRCVLDISAEPIVSIDLSRSVEDSEAVLALHAAPNIDVIPARLGFRIQGADGKIVERGSVEGENLKWTTLDFLQIGEFRLEVPKGAAVQCFASYNGQWLHQGWITDPRASINVRRVIHEAFDEGLSLTMKCFSDRKTKESNARVVETGVANLLYMLGFAVDPFSANHMSDAPDLLASTPTGDVLVVECTTGAIDADGKLSKLLSRTDLVSERLRNAGHNRIRCLPVMVTTLKLENETNVQNAAEKEVVVLSIEQLESLAETAKSKPDADRLFEQFRQRVRREEVSWTTLTESVRF